VRDDIEDLNEQVSKDLEKCEGLVKDHGSKPEAFHQVFETSSADHLRRVEKIWSDREALLKHVRADEWSAIFAGARAEAAKEGARRGPIAGRRARDRPGRRGP
jgi:hypothetical protein